MKYPATIYAKALVAVLEDASKNKHEAKAQDDLIAKHFLALVKKNGDESHLEKILDEASRLSRVKSGTRKVRVESARALTASQNASVKHFLKAGDIVEEHIDPELIAGIRITLNDELQFDGSLQHKLNKALGNL